MKRRSTFFVCLFRNTVLNEFVFFTYVVRRSFFLVINFCWYRIKFFRVFCIEILVCCYRLVYYYYFKRFDVVD